MAYGQMNPAELEGENLGDWFRRSPDEIEEEQALKDRARREAFFGRDGWQEARYVRPAPPPTAIRPAPETRAANLPGAPRRPGAPGSFFGTHAPLPNSNAYLPQLPAPLNRVEQTVMFPNMYELGDGTIVSSQEVERIYAEQERRKAGTDDPGPQDDVRSADRLKDGYIPQAGQLEKGQRERDATCHPYGGWELDPGFDSNSERARNYETQITRAEALDYVVRNPGEGAVKFDGCAVWDPHSPLLEAKGPGYEDLIEWGQKSGFINGLAAGPESQGKRQIEAAKGLPIEWHVAERRAWEFFKNLIHPRGPIRFVHTPAR